MKQSMEQIDVKVSSKGQMVIPAAIREQLGIERGTHVTVRVDGGRMIVDPQSFEAKIRRIKALRGCTKGGPSGTEILLEDRRRERERELREEGW